MERETGLIREFRNITQELRIAEHANNAPKAAHLSMCQQMLLRNMTPEEFAYAVVIDAYSRIVRRYTGN